MLLIGLMLAGVGSASADTYQTETLSTLSSGENTINNVKWSITMVGSTYFGSEARGCQFGSKNAPATSVTLTTSAFSGTITQIVVNASAYSSSATIGVTVGGNALGANSNLSNTNAAYTFEGSATGDIVITLTNASSGGRAMYVKSIAVTYSGGSQKIVAGLAFPKASYEIDEGEEFTAPALTNPHNLPVTYTSSETSVATVNQSTGAVTVVGVGTTTITASSEETEQYEAGEASYTLTINEVFQIEDGVFDFVAKESDYGSGVTTTSGSNVYINEEKTWTAGNVTLVTAGKYRWWNADGTLRFYSNTPKSTMTFSVPDGYVITKITLTGDKSFSASDYSSSTGIWTGTKPSVTLTYNASSGGVNVEKVVVEYKQGFSITSAKWTSLAAPAMVSFPTGVTGYIVTKATTAGVTLTEILAASEDTGIILNGSEGSYAFDEAEEGDLEFNDVALSANLLQVSDGAVTGGSTIFALSNGRQGVGFYKVASTVTIPEGKCYLVISGGQARSFVGFSDEVTAIESVTELDKQDSLPVYDLQGRRVNGAAKGLYIVGGKKVVM